MRILHTMLRVSDLERSISFYREIMQMELLRKKEYPDGKFTLAYLGYGPEREQAVLELTYNWESKHYEHGDAYGHLAIGVDDIQALCQRVEDWRDPSFARVTRAPGPMKFGGSVIAFISDPDNYTLELIETKP